MSDPTGVGSIQLLPTFFVLKTSHLETIMSCKRIEKRDTDNNVTYIGTGGDFAFLGWRL